METERRHLVCGRCGASCRWPGYVRASAAELDAIAAYLQVPARELIESHAIVTADRRDLSLAERPDHSCVFLEDGSVCTIYPVRPRQCREFPNGWRFPGFEKVCHATDPGPGGPAGGRTDG